MTNTFSCQHSLPQQPVPSLADTSQKMLYWAKPLLTEQEYQDCTRKLSPLLSKEPGDNDAEPSSVFTSSHQLHNDLMEWVNDNSNWADQVWRSLYLESRSSLVINSNVFYYLKSKLDEAVHDPAYVAAALIRRVYQFIQLVDSQSLTVDKQQDNPLCMKQYLNLFSSVRVAKPFTDELRVSSCRKHIVVMCNGNIYQVRILDEQGAIRSVSHLESDLNTIRGDLEKGQNIGVMTTLPRDDWAKNRSALMRLSKANHQSMRAIENAAFALCLDSNTPTELNEVSKQLLHGDGYDRFFDKSLQFVVFENGKTGINFEHTGVDGAVMLRLVGHIYDTIGQHPNSATATDIGINIEIAPSIHHKSYLQKLEFEVDSELRETIAGAKKQFLRHINNTQTRVLNFTAFGKNTIKTFGVSPDAFVQLALQLAEYKLYGKFYSAYEAVMTRTFSDGRIDVLYTISPESKAFVANIMNATCDHDTKVQSLISASKAHVSRAKECRGGQGIYTHLLALKHRYKVMEESKVFTEEPSIISNLAYEKLMHSVVCTSTTSEYGVELAGYGPIVDDGYGIRYFTRGDSVCFNLTSRTVMEDKLDKMVNYIEQSLNEMAELMAKQC